MIKSVDKLSGAPVNSTDIRTGASLIIAALQAEGESTITGIDHIERGYENIVSLLKSIGSEIEYNWIMVDLNLPKVKDRDPSSDIDMDVLNTTIEYIRPAVQADGGDIKLASVEDGVVNIEMLGACQGCPLSIATLKSGIERILKDKVPGVIEVIAT